MPNPIKYTTGSESLALKKGNFYIGTGDVGKGPTSETGFYNGVDPPSGGYTIYLNKASGGPSIYTASNDAQLISLTNSIAGTSYTTANECFVYFAGQTDKMVLNRNYEGIVTDGLVFNLDAGFTPSYPRNGTTWYDVSGSNNGEIVNGGTFSSNNSGNILLDGIDDRVILGSLSNNGSNYTLIFAFKSYTGTGSNDGYRLIGATGGATNQLSYSFDNNVLRIWPPNQWQTFDSNVSANNVYIVTQSSNTNATRMFVNGTFKTQFNITPIYFNNLGFGQPYVFCCGSYFNGELYFVQYYNRALSDSEVLQNYNAQKGRFGL
jgi:hypothetical protein